MKKLIAILAVSLLCSSVAVAGEISVSGFNPTKNVKSAYSSGASQTTYIIGTAHASGDRLFRTTSAYGGITYEVITPLGASGSISSLGSAPSSPTDSAKPTGTQL